MIRYLVGSSLMLIILMGIGLVFWYQQIQFLIPTPQPLDHQTVALGDTVNLSFLKGDTVQRPVFLHFYNPDCPCSRFNQDQFRWLVLEYRSQASFYTILPTSEKEPLSEQLGVPVITDLDGSIADACGVYASPQAVILTDKGSLYYQGNYNKARYCTTRSTRFAELALQAAIARQPLPLPVLRAGLPYGCNLPSDTLLPGPALYSVN